MTVGIGDIYSWGSYGIVADGSGGGTTTTGASIGGVSPATVRVYDEQSPGVVTGNHFGATQGTGYVQILTAGGAVAATPTILSWADARITYTLPDLAVAAYSVKVVANDASTDTYSAGHTYIADTITSRNALRDALKYCLTQITEASGYRTTIRAAYDPPRAWDSIPEFPSVNIVWGDEAEQETRIAGNMALLDLSWMCDLEVLLSEYNDPITAADNVLADIQEYFGRNFYIPGSDGARTAFNCLYKGSRLWGTESQRPNFGVTVQLQVWYRIRLDNPAQMS